MYKAKLSDRADSCDRLSLDEEIKLFFVLSNTMMDADARACVVHPALIGLDTP